MVTLILNREGGGEETIHFQKRLSETSADTIFLNLGKRYLYRFVTVRLFLKG